MMYFPPPDFSALQVGDLVECAPVSDGEPWFSGTALVTGKANCGTQIFVEGHGQWYHKRLRLAGKG